MAANQQAWRCRWTRHPETSTSTSISPLPICSCGCPFSSASSSSSSSSSSRPPGAGTPYPSCLCSSLLCQSISPRSAAATKGLQLVDIASRLADEIEMKESNNSNSGRGGGCTTRVLGVDDEWLSSRQLVGGRGDKQCGADEGENGRAAGIVSISRKRTRQNGWGVNSPTALQQQEAAAAAAAAQAAVAQAAAMVVIQNDESCKLPDHLIESVLARLPLQSFFRFRAVCSLWNSYLYSSTFIKAYYSEAEIRHNVWFLVVTANLGRSARYGHRVVATYDPEYNNWHRIGLPAPLCDLNPHPTVADGGLVCYFVYENRLRTLFVCNPLTKSLRKLPQVLKNSSHISVLKMVMEDRATNSYKVFVAGMVPDDSNSGDNMSMEVYNSSTDSWTKSGIIPAKYPKRKPVYGNGVLYVRCYDQRSLLLTFDTNLGVWNRIHAPLPHTLNYEELVHHQGHIFLVGILEENYKIDCVCIWELQKTTYTYVWKEVDRMPRVLFMEFFCDREYFECQEDERVLMKCSLYGDLILCVAFNISHRGPFKLLAYDLIHKTWRRMPESFQASKCRTHKFIEGTIYEPRLDVVA